MKVTIWLDVFPDGCPSIVKTESEMVKNVFSLPPLIENTKRYRIEIDVDTPYVVKNILQQNINVEKVNG